jgi:hypothetical protein
VRLLEENPEISQDTKELIRWKNARRLFQLSL